MSRLFKILVVSCLILNSPVVFGIDETHFSGKTLEEALRHFQFQGLNILFSSDLVRPEMKVTREPIGKSEDLILAQLLYPHGLKIQPGPEKTLLVVRTATTNSTKTSKETESPGGTETLVVPFVTVYFTARDDEDRPVTHLKAKHFMLQEDGKMQPLVEFANFAISEEREPLTVFFLLDSSHSMQSLQDGTRKYEVSKKALLGVLDQMQPQDQMMAIGFHEKSWIISEMTQDIESVRRSVTAGKATLGKTALYDTLISTVKQSRNYSGRKVIIICSDGDDNSSKSSLKDVTTLLKSTDVTVMTFGTKMRGDIEKKGREALQSIAEVTGGSAFFSARMTDLESVIADFRNIMESQYVAGYVPPEPLMHKRREVRIHCLIPGIQLHYRKSYLF
jgi:Ca-activated chloride channel family protein